MHATKTLSPAPGYRALRHATWHTAVAGSWPHVGQQLHYQQLQGKTMALTDGRGSAAFSVAPSIMPDRFPRASGGDYARSSLRGSFMPPTRQSGLPLRQSGLRQSGMQLRQSGLPGRQGISNSV